MLNRRGFVGSVLSAVGMAKVLPAASVSRPTCEDKRAAMDRLGALISATPTDMESVSRPNFDMSDRERFHRIYADVVMNRRGSREND